MFLTHKEPVHKSYLLMKPTTLGALRARATIVHSLLKDVFLPLFCVTLSSPRLKSSTWNTAYIYILFCDNSGVAGGVAQLFLRVAVATPCHPGRSAPATHIYFASNAHDIYIYIYSDGNNGIINKRRYCFQ